MVPTVRSVRNLVHVLAFLAGTLVSGMARILSFLRPVISCTDSLCLVWVVLLQCSVYLHPRGPVQCRFPDPIRLGCLLSEAGVSLPVCSVFEPRSPEPRSSGLKTSRTSPSGMCWGFWSTAPRPAPSCFHWLLFREGSGQLGLLFFF